MTPEKQHKRFMVMLLITATLLAALSMPLVNLQLIHGDAMADRSESNKRRELTVKGTRGQILDSNMIPMAYSVKSYDVEFYKDPSRATREYNQQYTQVLIEGIGIIEKNGGKVIDTFAIRQDESGTFYFDFKTSNTNVYFRRKAQWLQNMYIPSAMRAPANLEPDTERDEAFRALEHEQAKTIYEHLRGRYQIPEELPYTEAIQLMGIWQEVQLSQYMAYVPVRIAQNVDLETVVEIETLGTRLVGLSISQSTARVYPKTTLAAHIVGYTSRMTDENTIQEYIEKGYSRDDWIGATGIERSFEAYLTGNSTERQGTRVVEVNSIGKVVNEISQTPASQGDSVVLTIDSYMQRKLEETLAQNVRIVYEAQQKAYQKDPEKYDDLVASRGGLPISYAKMGAAVVINVKTGQILAMASVPSYDPGLFTDGISQADFDALNEDDAYPLFNKAISSRAAPGSIFKMITGVAGLMEGAVTLDEQIDDESPFMKYTQNAKQAPRCYIWPSVSLHQNMDLEAALRDSCNYYFFEVSSRIGIEKLNKWTKLFGLTDPTGVELPGEVSGQMASQEALYEPDKPVSQQGTAIPLLVSRNIKTYLQTLGGEMGIVYDETKLNSVAEKLLRIAVELSATGENLGPGVREVLMDDLGMPPAIVRGSKRPDLAISQMLTEVIWNPNQTLTAAIGQSLTVVTPVAIARYIAALVNGGTVYEAQLVDKVIDQNGVVVLDKAPVIFQTLDVPQEYLDRIKKGMRDVVDPQEGGTAASAFAGFQYIDQVGGKTGSAQTSRIDLETHSWFVAFAPYDDPEIAVVVHIPNGMGGIHSTYTAKEIIQYYLEGKGQSPERAIGPANQLVP